MERNRVQCGRCPGRKIYYVTNSMYCTRCSVYLCLDCCERDCSRGGDHVLVAAEKGPVEKREMPTQAPIAKKSGCFIATAVYGSQIAPEVIIFRRFRDETLLSSKFGVTFVRAYYFVSPAIARIILKHKLLRTITRRVFLEPILRVIEISITKEE